MSRNYNARSPRNFVAFAAVLACGWLGHAQPVADAVASPESSPRHTEIPVNVASVRNFHVTSLGRVLDDSPYAPRACNVVASHTDANFGGGSYVAQAGFAQGEQFGATYTVSAAEFPIKINLAEMIFVTSGASQNTVTQWAVSFWAGNPQTGTLVATESSDDVVLPHIRMGPGTNGVNLRFSIDPMDSDQIVINDNGSHQFSISWRINQHNMPPANACTTSPPTCCNAFPATDTSGLARPAANWLFGLNCGAIGCPANGGWSTFGSLPFFCPPTGDVVTRVTWSSLTCQPGVGACCLPDGTCQAATEQGCADLSGTFRGEFSSCTTANCPAPSGACCFGTFCTSLSPVNCAGAMGTYLGNNVVCSGPSANQCPLGACCLPNGSCVGGVSSSQCASQGGSFRGVGSTCAGACPTGGCCRPDGSCVIATEIQCTAQNGTWRGAGTNCTGANCPQPDGACCLPGFCLETTEDICGNIPDGVWAGAFSTCADLDSNGVADICDTGIPCPADYNQDGGITGDDITAFFIDWSAAAGHSDVNQDGGIDGQDVEYFFVRWEAGGC